jgi:hypothetical protein
MVQNDYMRNLILTALCGLFACTLTASGNGLALTLTEVSSTQLTYSWSSGQSGSVGLTSPDNWSGVISGPNITTDDVLSGSWQEPGSTTVNTVLVDVDSPGVFSVLVQSDVTGTPSVSNGGDKLSSQGTFDVVFIDNAVETPDAGNTFSILFLSILPFCGGTIAESPQKFKVMISLQKARL